MSNENSPHVTESVTCQHCEHQWQAVYPITGHDVQSLECPNCHKGNWLTVIDDRPIHLVISYNTGDTWLKPSRAVPVYKLQQMLRTALKMLDKCSHLKVAVPEDFPLVVGMTVHYPENVLPEECLE